MCYMSSYQNYMSLLNASLQQSRRFSSSFFSCFQAMSINSNMTNLVVYLTNFVHFNIKKFFAHAETYEHTKCPFSIQTILWPRLESKLPTFCFLFPLFSSLLSLHFHHLLTRAEFKFYKTAQLNSRRRRRSEGSCCKYRATNTSPNLNLFFCLQLATNNTNHWMWLWLYFSFVTEVIVLVCAF